jgi:hypothetical protein
VACIDATSSVASLVGGVPRIDHFLFQEFILPRFANFHADPDEVLSAPQRESC